MRTYVIKGMVWSNGQVDLGSVRIQVDSDDPMIALRRSGKMWNRKLKTLCRKNTKSVKAAVHGGGRLVLEVALPSIHDPD